MNCAQNSERNIMVKAQWYFLYNYVILNNREIVSALDWRTRWKRTS